MRVPALHPSVGLLIAASLLFLAPRTRAQGSAGRDGRDPRVVAFERAFRATAKEPRTPEERLQALAGLSGADDSSVAEALIGAWEQCAQELALALEERLKAEGEIAEHLEGQEFGPRALTPSAAESIKRLEARARVLAQQEEGLRGVESALGEALAGLRSEPALAGLLAAALARGELPFSLRLKAVESAGPLAGAAVTPLTRVLAKAKANEDIVVALVGLGCCGKAAASAAPGVIGLLAHADSSVRAQAAHALGRLAAPEGIEPLVARLAQERGHMRRRLGIALETLTGVDLGTNAGAWKAWFAKEGARYAGGEVELGAGRSKLAEEAADPQPLDERYAASFYGIPLDGEAIVYAIDCSGSMVVSSDDPEWRDGKPVDAGEASRMEATKAALIAVLGKLEPRHRFDIVCFNDVVRAHAPALLEARASEVKRAQAWVAELQASDATNIHDALQQAFRLGGRGAQDRYYPSAVDTIFLLTDGTPTWNDGELDETERIHAAVQAWNPLRHVVVHTIGIGRDVNASFLRRLARENGGSYVQM